MAGCALGAVTADKERRQRTVAMRIVREMKRVGRVTRLARACELPEVHVRVTRTAFVRNALESGGRARPRGKRSRLDLVARRARHLRVLSCQRKPELGVNDVLDGELRRAHGVAPLARRPFLSQVHITMAAHTGRRRALEGCEHD